MDKPYETNKVMYHFEYFANLVTANVLFIVSYIPIVTAGIGSIVLSDYTREFKDNPYKAGRQMLHLSKENWKFGLKIGLVQAICLIAFGVNIVGLASLEMNSVIFVVMLSLLFFSAFIFLMVMSLLYVLEIDRQRPLIDLAVDSLRIGLLNIRATLLLMGWNLFNLVLSIVLLLFSRYLSLYYISVGFAVQSLVTHRIIKDIKK